MRYDLKSARELATRVCLAASASKAVAHSLAEATVAAECSGGEYVTPSPYINTKKATKLLPFLCCE